MDVHVKFSGLLRDRSAAAGPGTVELPDGATLRDLYARMEISPSEGSIAVADGIVLHLDSPLADGMAVCFYPLMSGG
jgi:molybdopterin converting factor small subunit